MVEPLEQVREALSRGSAWKAVSADWIVGAVRTVERAGVLHIGRLGVVPDRQGEGIDTALVQACLEAAGPGVRRAALFTGARSTANLQLYERLGFLIERRERPASGIELVHLSKELSRVG
ncbi:MAG: GNAT family N-acetyltransferase [Actinomycetota bacterium]|nr:GNAT family N-acetyltransferase [Actinomycetota bacterium]